MFSFYLTIATLLIVSCNGTIQQCRFKLLNFSDAIFEANYEKTSLKFTGDDALKNCGTMCSVKGEDCQLFKYDKAQGKYSLRNLEFT